MTKSTRTFIPVGMLLTVALAAASARADEPAVKPGTMVADAKKLSTVGTVAQGQEIEVTASGEWSIDSRNLYGKFGPDGSTNGKPTEACTLVPTAKMGALVGTLVHRR